MKKYSLVGVGKINYDIVDSARGREAFVGGHVPNIVSSAQQIGLRTALVARVGKDEEGKACLAELRRRGVNVSYVTVDDDPTPVCKTKLIGEERVLVPLPAKLTMYTNAHRPAIQNTNAVIIERNTVNFEACVRDCVDAKVLTASSLQHYPTGEKEGAKKLMAHPPDILFANKKEAERDRGVVDAVLSKGGTVVITLGSMGCQVEKASHKASYNAFKTSEIDTTGAGDAFAAGYLLGLLRGFDEQRTASIANAMGAITVSQIGPVPSVTWIDVETFLAEKSTMLA